MRISQDFSELRTQAQEAVTQKASTFVMDPLVLLELIEYSQDLEDSLSSVEHRVSHLESDIADLEREASELRSEIEGEDLERGVFN